MSIYAGDENDHWDDAGPCPACGRSDCWLMCDEALGIQLEEDAGFIGVDY